MTSLKTKHSIIAGFILGVTIFGCVSINLYYLKKQRDIRAANTVLSEKIKESELLLRSFEEKTTLLPSLKMTLASTSAELEKVRMDKTDRKNKLLNLQKQKKDLEKSTESLRSRTFPPGAERLVFAMTLKAPSSASLSLSNLGFGDQLYDEEGLIAGEKEFRQTGTRPSNIPNSGDLETFELWDEDGLVGREPTLQYSAWIGRLSINFQKVRIYIPAGKMKKFYLKAKISESAKIGNRHGIGFNGADFAGGFHDQNEVEKTVIAPIFSIGNTPTPSVQFYPDFEFNGMPWPLNKSRTVYWQVINPPKDAKIAVVLQNLLTKETYVMKENLSPYDRHVTTSPSSTKHCLSANTNCFSLSFALYNVKVVLYRGEQYCEKNCPEGFDVVSVAGTSKSFLIGPQEKYSQNADLIVKSFELTPSPFMWKGKGTLTIVFKNIGTEPVTENNIRFRTHNIHYLGGIMVFDNYIPKIPAGGEFVYTQTIDNDPPKLAPGEINTTYKYYSLALSCSPEGTANTLQTIIDVDNVVAEIDEQNNLIEKIIYCKS